MPVISAKCQASITRPFPHVFTVLTSMDKRSSIPFSAPSPRFSNSRLIPPPNPHSSYSKYYNKQPFFIAKHKFQRPLLGEDRPSSGTGRGEGTRQAELGREPLDAVGGVEVFDHDHLEAGGAALARGDGGPGQEELPDAVPALAELGVDGLGVAQPVAVPPPEGARVVDADGVDAADWGLAFTTLCAGGSGISGGGRKR